MKKDSVKGWKDVFTFTLTQTLKSKAYRETLVIMLLLWMPIFKIHQLFCRKCFLYEMELQGGLKASYEAMLERIEMMDPELRCTKEVYEERLAECKKCEYLMEAMCGLCGCFAESRAAVKANSCPANPKRWEVSE